MAKQDKKPNLHEIIGDIIDIDSDNLALYNIADVIADIPAAVIYMISDETGLKPFGYNGEVKASKDKDFVDLEGDYSLKIYGTTADGKECEIQTVGEWAVVDYISTIENNKDIQIATRLHIVCKIEDVISK